MKTRILTSLLILLVVLPPILLGGWLLQLLALFVIVTAWIEWEKNAPGYKEWALFLLPGLVVWTLLEGLFPGIRSIVFSLGVMIIWSLPVFCKTFSVFDSLLTMSFMMIVSAAYNGIQALIPHHLYLLTICLANYGSDTGAYFAGRTFGKHKMAPVISPKKTWEGFFGGWIFGFLLSFLVSMLYNSSLDPVLNLLICLLVPVGAAIGDLCFSSMKRYWKIKDFSSFLPGHGGLLDRLDSLIFNLILFNLLAGFF